MKQFSFAARIAVWADDEASAFDDADQLCQAMQKSGDLSIYLIPDEKATIENEDNE